jgi:hypothetical protein
MSWVSFLYNDDSIILEMNKLETCHHCGKQKENCYHGFIALTIPHPDWEAKIEKWNLIDAYKNYINNPAYKAESVADLMSSQAGQLVKCPTQEEFINKIKTDNEFSKKWCTKTWWKQLERTDLTPEQMEELDHICSYDQALNTVGRGVQCDDCGKKEAELYEKYYPKSLES